MQDACRECDTRCYARGYRGRDGMHGQRRGGRSNPTRLGVEEDRLVVALKVNVPDQDAVLLTRRVGDQRVTTIGRDESQDGIVVVGRVIGEV